MLIALYFKMEERKNKERIFFFFFLIRNQKQLSSYNNTSILGILAEYCHTQQTK